MYNIIPQYSSHRLITSCLSVQSAYQCVFIGKVAPEDSLFENRVLTSQALCQCRDTFLFVFTCSNWRYTMKTGVWLDYHNMNNNIMSYASHECWQCILLCCQIISLECVCGIEDLKRIGSIQPCQYGLVVILKPLFCWLNWGRDILCCFPGGVLLVSW